MSARKEIKKPQLFEKQTVEVFNCTRKPTNIELYYAGCGHNSPACKACGSSYIMQQAVE